LNGAKRLNDLNGLNLRFVVNLLSVLFVGRAESDVNHPLRSNMAEADHEWGSSQYAREWVSKNDRRAEERAAQLNAAIQWLSIFLQPPAHVIDLGAGPGTLAEKILLTFPEIQVTCLDGSEEMLNVAKQRLASFANRLSFIQADFGLETWTSNLPQGIDAIVTARAIHNVRKLKFIERVYKDIYNVLRPGGFFLNIERVNFSSRTLRRYYRQLQMKSRGRAAKVDGPAPSLVQQLRLLKRAGFKDIDCFWREGNTAIVGGFRRE
jgi:tRNA (cmo5U34)-methyltransferase